MGSSTLEGSLGRRPADSGDRLPGTSQTARGSTARKKVGELTRLNRLYAALSALNRSIIQGTERVELFSNVCRALVVEGGFGMAWIGGEAPGSNKLVSQASWGTGVEYLSEIQVLTDDTEEGQGPGGRAFCNGRAYICNDIGQDPRMLPWLPACEKYGLKSVAALPIWLREAVDSILVVYGYERGLFQQRETALLQEAASNVSFALENIVRDRERREAEDVIRQERNFSSMIIESLPGIFYFFDENGRYLRFNRNFVQASGYSEAEFAAMHPLNFIPESQRGPVDANIREVFAKGESSIESDLLSKDGSLTHYLFTGRRVDVGGKVGLLGLGLDITKRKRAEAEVARLNADLEWRVMERTRQLKEANDDLRVFSYTLSHDLRAPLRAINGFAEILLHQHADLLNDECRRLVDRIRNRGQQMRQLIGDLIDFFQAGTQPLQRRTVSMERVVRSAMLEIELMLKGRRVDFHIGRLPTCTCDPTAMQRVWVNLLDNAVKFSSRQTAPVIEVGTELQNGEEVFFVRDNGAGFDMQFASKLFAVFQRLHPAVEFEGAGIGLAIVQRIILLHGGRVWAHGEDRRGATFYFTVPTVRHPTRENPH